MKHASAFIVGFLLVSVGTGAGTNSDDVSDLLRTQGYTSAWLVSSPTEGYVRTVAACFTKGAAPILCVVNAGAQLITLEVVDGVGFMSALAAKQPTGTYPMDWVPDATHAVRLIMDAMESTGATPGVAERIVLIPTSSDLTANPWMLFVLDASGEGTCYLSDGSGTKRVCDAWWQVGSTFDIRGRSNTMIEAIKHGKTVVLGDRGTISISSAGNSARIWLAAPWDALLGGKPAELTKTVVQNHIAAISSIWSGSADFDQICKLVAQSPADWDELPAQDPILWVVRP